jgi:hypothetical protein
VAVKRSVKPLSALSEWALKSQPARGSARCKQIGDGGRGRRRKLAGTRSVAVESAGGEFDSESPSSASY